MLPSIAQLVERRTVVIPRVDILRSLVRFRLEGSAWVSFFYPSRRPLAPSTSALYIGLGPFISRSRPFSQDKALLKPITYLSFLKSMDKCPSA